MEQRDYKPILAGIIYSSIFGLSFLVTKTGLDIVEPYHLLALRFGFAAILFLILNLTGIINIDLKGKKISQLIGLSIIVPIIYFICEVNGVNLTSSSEAGMILALVPVTTTVIAAIVLKEKTTIKQSFFILISVVGVFLIIYMRGNIEIGESFIGSYLLLAAVTSVGFFNVFSRKLSSDFSAVETTFVMMVVGAIVFNSVAISQHIFTNKLGEYLIPLLNWQVLAAVSYLGILSSVLAFFMLNYMLSKMEASKSSVFANLATVISIAAGVVFRNEALYWFHIAGSLMILLGVWGTNYYTYKEKEVGKIKGIKDMEPINNK